jgi:hypothetical protein
MRIKRGKPGAGFAWRFHFGLKALKRAYKSSRLTADKEKGNFEREATTIHEVEHDEGGGYENYLSDMVHQQEQVLSIVRLAFVISLHHYFEKQMLEQLDAENYVQSNAISLLKGYGWEPLETQLNELRLAANCAKHSKGKSAEQLYALRSDMFGPSKIKMDFKPGYDNLALSDAHVESFFDAVRKSVPSNLGIVF